MRTTIPSEKLRCSILPSFLAGFLLLTSFSLHAEADVDKTLRFLPDMARPLAVHLALPEQFTVGAFPTDSKPNLGTGLIWGTTEAIRELAQQQQPGKKSICSQGIFRVKITSNITQTAADKFSFGDDASLSEDLKKSGAKDITITRVIWGEYPVVAATFKLQDGSPQAIAWVGFNYDSYTLFISYQFPANKKSYEDDYIIWNTFITKTTLLPPREYLKALGYEFDLGMTTYTRAHAKTQFTSQKLLGGKTTIFIEPLTEKTSCVAIASTRRTAKQAKASRVDLVVDIESSVDNIDAAGEEMIPLFPELVEKITLTGTLTYEDDDVIVIMKKLGNSAPKK